MRPDEFPSSQRYCASAGKDGGQVPALAFFRAGRAFPCSHFRGGRPGGTGPPFPSRCPAERRPQPLPGRGSSPRSAGHAGLGTPTPSQLGFCLVGLAGGRVTSEEAPEEVWACSPRAAAARRGWERSSPGRPRRDGAAPPSSGGAAGEPRLLPPISLSPGRGGLPAFCPVQICFFSPRFLITLLNLNGLFFGRYDRV